MNLITKVLLLLLIYYLFFFKDPSWKNRHNCRLNHYRRPSDVRPREERRPTVAEIAQQKYVLQRLHGWKIYQLTAQMEDLAELEKQVNIYLKLFDL